jgi:hypothetical protein
MTEITTKKTAGFVPMTPIGTSNDTDDQSSQSCLRKSDASQLQELTFDREHLSDEERRWQEGLLRWEEKIRSNLSSLEADLEQFGRDRIARIKEKCAGNI